MNRNSDQTTTVTLPWLMLVTPARTWETIKRLRFSYWAVTFHWVAALLGAMISFEANQDLLVSAGLTTLPQQQSTSAVIVSAASLLIAVVALCSAATLICILLLRAIKVQAGFNSVFTWLTYGLIPLALGNLLSKLLFTIIRPLADSSVLALAFLIKPFSFGIASFLPESITPLTFSWFMLTSLDLFGLWTLWLLIVGARILFNLNAQQKFWLITELVLLFIAVITGLWNATQYLLLRLTS